MTHLNTQGQTEGAIHDQTEAEKEYDLVSESGKLITRGAVCMSSLLCFQY